MSKYKDYYVWNTDEWAKTMTAANYGYATVTAPIDEDMSTPSMDNPVIRRLSGETFVVKVGTSLYLDAAGGVVAKKNGVVQPECRFATRAEAEVVQGRQINKANAIPEEIEDMPNTHFAGWITTTKTTPVLAQWLIDQFKRIQRPQRSYEYYLQEHFRNLQSTLGDYHKHRGEADPHRSATYKNLKQRVEGCLHVIRDYLSHRMAARVGDQQANVELPMDEATIVTAIESALGDEGYLMECSGCGSYRLNVKDYGEYAYCVPCQGLWMIHCEHCHREYSTRHRSDNLQALRDNDSRGTKHVCKCQAPKARVCVQCERSFLGQDIPVDNVSLEELKAAHLYPLCYNCAAHVRRLECGHVHQQHKRVTEMESVEDDARPKPVKEKLVCPKCYEGCDTRPEHWAAEVPALVGKTFDDIGSQRTFGIEIEVCQVRDIKALLKNTRRYWHAKADASLPEGGVEFASSILQGDEGLMIVRQLCNYASEKRWAVNERAGLHVHVGIKDLNDVQVSAVALGYLFTNQLWKCFVSPSRHKSKYCTDHHTPIEQFKKKVKGEIISLLVDGEERRRWVNWHSYKTHGTVEIRLHGGTLNYDKIAYWTKAHMRFVDWCVSVGTPGGIWKILDPMKGDVRKLFLFMVQNVWQDRRLGTFLRLRSHKFATSSLPMTNYMASQARKFLGKEKTDLVARKYLIALAKEDGGREQITHLSGLMGSVMQPIAKKKIQPARF